MKIRETEAVFHNQSFLTIFTEAALLRCSEEKMFGKCAVNLQENTHAEV